ncbi:hypothetical protein PO124_26980 [Bacillus licheniformis]|nr:hypothetical protein [Bacillus licheniformis]
MNPDYMFVQFSDDENADNPNALKDLEKIQFGKHFCSENDRVFVNAVDPLAQGGTAWSKVEF